MEDWRPGRWGSHLTLVALPLVYALVVRDAGPAAAVAGLSLWLAGRAAASPAPALLVQAAPFLPPVVPDPVMAAASALLLAALLPLARGREPGDGHATLAGAAVAMGTVVEPGFAGLAVLPVLLFDRRRFLVYGPVVVAGIAAALVLARPAAVPAPSWWLLAAVDAPVAVVLAAYVRMRRRGLMERDRRARLLAGILAAQALVAAATAGRDPMPALLLAGPALALLWPMTLRLGDIRLRRRLWLAGMVMLAAVRLAHLA